MKTVFVRTCQECFHKHVSKNTTEYRKHLPETWKNIKCPKCNTPKLNFGTEMHQDANGKLHIMEYDFFDCDKRKL
jgi:hypothetical protein